MRRFQPVLVRGAWHAAAAWLFVVPAAAVPSRA